MKKLIATTMVVAVLAVAGAAMARNGSSRPSDAEVNAAIDARLHEMLVKLNTHKK